MSYFSTGGKILHEFNRKELNEISNKDFTRFQQKEKNANKEIKKHAYMKGNVFIYAYDYFALKLSLS